MAKYRFGSQSRAVYTEQHFAKQEGARRQERSGRRHPQARLTGATRRHNLRGAFLVGLRHRRRLRDRRVLLVDDVVTSGATMNEAARALKEAGASSVSGLAMSHTEG